MSDLRRRENKFETEEGGLLEVYTRIDSPEGEPLLFEAYYSVADGRSSGPPRCSTPFRRISARRPARDPAARRHRCIVGADPAADPRQPGPRAADGARHRLLGGRAPPDRPRPPRRRRPGAGRYGVRALRRPPASPASSPELRGRLDARRARRCAARLRQLRSLLVEIHPPGLNAAGLGAALEDLTAPAAGAGVTPTSSVGRRRGGRPRPRGRAGVAGRPGGDPQRGPARRHATRLTVEVRGDGRQVRLDGPGRRRRASTRPADGRQGSYGLRGLQSLVRGRRRPARRCSRRRGAGTTVRMAVDRG